MDWKSKNIYLVLFSETVRLEPSTLSLVSSAQRKTALRGEWECFGVIHLETCIYLCQVIKGSFFSRYPQRLFQTRRKDCGERRAWMPHSSQQNITSKINLKYIKLMILIITSQVTTRSSKYAANQKVRLKPIGRT